MNTDPTSSDRRRFASRPRDHATPSIPGYHVLERISDGPNSSTYRAVQLSMQREVALQILLPWLPKTPGFTERFMQEARSAGAVHHPHVVACYDVGQSGGVIYQALELMIGQSLPGYLVENASANEANNHCLTPAHAISLVVDATRGLEAVHRAGLIHGDLRISNIFVTNDEVVKIAGFGMSRSIEVMREGERDAQEEAERGALAPENFISGGRVDIRSDLYALGATLYVLLTGEQPFTRKNNRDLSDVVRHAPIPDPREIIKNLNADLVAVMTKAMAKDPADRYATPGQLREDLERVQYDFAPIHAVPLTAGNGYRGVISDGSIEPPAMHSPVEPSHSPSNTIAKNASFMVLPRAEESGNDFRRVTFLSALKIAGIAGVAGVAISAYFWFNRSHVVVAESVVSSPIPAPAHVPKVIAPETVVPVWASAGGTDDHGRWLDIPIRGVPLRLRFVPTGRFVMGSLATNPAFRPDEQAVEVTLSHNFWMGESEVTQAQYFSLMGTKPSGFRGDRLPVENITWHESVAFTRRLNSFIPGLHARLPTEAEWEYACRAGSEEHASSLPIGWFSGPNISSSQVVMGLPANAWGLYDMQGNVMEWCQDMYGPYPSQPSIDPLQLDGISRVARGGSWAVDISEGRPATRGKYLPVAHHAHLGMRIVVEE